MKALKLNFKLILISVFTCGLTLFFLGNAFPAKAVNCNIECKRCGSVEVNHFHSSTENCIWVKCRECNYKYSIPEEGN